MAEVTYSARIRLVHESRFGLRAEMPSGTTTHFTVHDFLHHHHDEPAQAAESTSQRRAPAPLDTLVAATGASLLGTFAGALEARGIAIAGGRLWATTVGEAETEALVLVLKRIHVTYRMASDSETDTAEVEHLQRVHSEACPMTRSIHPQIQVTTALEWAQGAPDSTPER